MPASSSVSHLLRSAAALLRALGARGSTSTRERPRPPRPPRPAGPTAPQTARRTLPDHVGAVPIHYSPEPDGAADPGEIVWTWVPYEEDATQGKDRPVLVVGWDGPVVLGLMLTSTDHGRSAAREARKGRVWMDIGSGPWDARRRDSEVRLDRVLRLDPDSIRREGAVVDHDLFVRVTDALTELRGRV